MHALRAHVWTAPARVIVKDGRVVAASLVRRSKSKPVTYDSARAASSGANVHDSRQSHTIVNFAHARTSSLTHLLTPRSRVRKLDTSLLRGKFRNERQAQVRGTTPPSLDKNFSSLRQPARSRSDTHLGERGEKSLPTAPSQTIKSPMTSEVTSTPPSKISPAAQHRPLVVGRTKPQSTPATMADSSAPDKAVPADVKAALNHEIADNVKANTSAAAPDAPPANKPKKEKAPKQPKPPKAPATPAAPVSPALIDLRVGHILRAIAHPNADSLYVSTIAMGDAEGTEHTQVDEETGKVVRTVCSGLNGLIPLEEMQNRKVVVVANLKPVNMRSIKSAAMVLAASPPAEEGADPHAADRVVELVNPPEGAEAGDAVFFEGWPYGEGKGPEKQLNPKKKVWESVQPGFFTSDDLAVGFDAGRPGVEIDGEKDKKGWLVVEGKGRCTVKTLKGAVVR